MAQQTTVTVDDDDWTELTDANVTSITIGNKSNTATLILAVTVGAVAPTDFDGAFHVPPGGLIINESLADLAPGIAGTRIYARSASGPCPVHVSHG